MILTIDRKLWLRGEGAEKSALLRKDDGKMCCLGFYGLACGIPTEDLADKKQPNELKGVPNTPYPEWLTHNYVGDLDKKQYSGVSTACCSLMRVNDARSITDEAREAEITVLFAQHDVQVEFVG